MSFVSSSLNLCEPDLPKIGPYVLPRKTEIAEPLLFAIKDWMGYQKQSKSALAARSLLLPLRGLTQKALMVRMTVMKIK